MKKVLKLLVAVVCVFAMVASFAGCGSENPAVDNAEKAEFTIGTNAEFPPFEFVDSELGVVGEFAGIDVEIGKAIADSMEAEAVINNMDFDSLLIALSNDQVDCVIAGMTITEERLEEVDFSVPYYKATQVMIVAEDSDIAKAADIADKKIGVIDGYTGQTCVEELGYDFNGYKKGADAVLDLANGKLDVVVIDSSTAEKFVAENEGLKIVEDAETFASEEYGIAVKKGNTELLDKINAKIEAMLADGTIDGFCTKYEG